MNREEAILATNIAILRTLSPLVDPVTLILGSLRTIRLLNIAADEGAESHEHAVSEFGSITATATSALIAKWTVTARRTGLLASVEMACSDYDLGQFKLVIGGITMWEDKLLPTAMAQIFLGTTLLAGETVEVWGKDSGSGITMWAAIDGKETS